uniref:Uncharacterized protein n=1 Tax=Rhizophora mucronata TaxID=61149 RepID=A0A2P2PZD3_RHIMU
MPSATVDWPEKQKALVN